MKRNIFWTLLVVVVIAGCSDPEEEKRVTFCKGLGISDADRLALCEKGGNKYRSIIDPILRQREEQEIEAYNNSIAIFANYDRSMNLDIGEYEKLTVEEMNKKYDCCSLQFSTRGEEEKHPLYGKRFLVSGEINFWPSNEESGDENFSLDQQDKNDSMNTWSIDIDIESLGREQRDFIRENCNAYFGYCVGEIYGAIGPLHQKQIGNIDTIGLRAEKVVLHRRNIDE